MPCYPFKIGDTTGIICTSRRRPKPCAYCGAPHTRLCDGLLEKPIGKRKTCDRPMCDRCTHRVGPEEDYCREHRPQPPKSAGPLERIIVVNYKHIRKEAERRGELLEETIIYIGRAMPSFDLAASPLQNIYRVGVDPDPLGQYKKWLWRQIQIQSKAFDELSRIRDLVKDGQTVKLACWCKDSNGQGDCHGDIVKAAIEWMMKET